MAKNAYAVLIGINEYDDQQNLQTLRYAEKDCEDLQLLLNDTSIGVFPKENTRILIGPEATTRVIEEVLYTDVVKDRSPDDLVLVYFSGHGFIAGDQQLAYLGSRDVCVSQLLKNPNSGLRMDRIHDDIFLASRARYVVFLLDCCHSGALTPTTVKSLAGSAPRDLIDNRFFSSQNGRIAIVSCPPDALSRESFDLQNGVFTHHILRSLSGAAAAPDTGEVALDDLLAYVRNHMPPEQPPGCYGRWFDRIVLSKPGIESGLRSQRLALDIDGLTNAFSAKPLSNPLDPYMFFLDRLLSQLNENQQDLSPEVETRILNAIGRASDAERVFTLRFDGTDWILKSQSSFRLDASREPEKLEAVVSKVLGSISRRIAGRAFSLSESYEYTYDDEYKTFVVIPLVVGPISEYLIVYGLEANSYLLGEVYSHILGALYKSTKGMTAIQPLVVEASIIDKMRGTFGYVPLNIYDRRFDLFRERLTRMDVFFEPILYLSPQNLYICGWEGLARDPVNEISPADLFTTAELWGRHFITELDIYFVTTAMRRYRQALAEAKMQRPHEMQDLSINVYPDSLMRSAYFSAVREALKENDLLPQKIILEISEKAPIPEDAHDIEGFRQRLMEFVSDLSIGFAIDDFGVGYASVSRLVRLNPLYVKIDRDVLLHQFTDSTIRFVLDVVKQGRLHSQKVVVEGFDGSSRITLDDLYKLGIRYIQGYVVGRAGASLYRLDKDLKHYLETLLALSV